MTCGPFRHDWMQGTTSWNSGDVEKLTKIGIICRRCGVERWRLVGWWNRRRWSRRFDLRPRRFNSDCYACRDTHVSGSLDLNTSCSRSGCERPAASVVIHVWSQNSGRRWSYLCERCEREHNDWFYGRPTRWDEPADSGWLFTPPETGVIA